ncbi:hypothetical protein L1887_25859 [Cichorium endivia]|nr:hypothetical protein L1887_25859 [Cichorium endivia]
MAMTRSSKSIRDVPGDSKRIKAMDYIRTNSVAIVMINKEKPPDAVFPQIMRDTKQRNGGNDSLGNDNLELKPPDLVLVAVGAEGVNDQEQRRRHTDYKEGDP